MMRHKRLLSLLLVSWTAATLVTAVGGADKRACVSGPHNYPAPSDNVSISTKLAASNKHGAPERFLVHWKTSIGSADADDNNDNNSLITVEIIREWSPIGVDRFYQLILDKFYNCATFFRVVPNFIVQFGIAADKDETAKWDVPIADDNQNSTDTQIQSNVAGTLTYATAGANTRTSQVFVNLQNNAHLDSMGFTPIGRVLTGMGALRSRVYNPTPGKSGGIDQDELMNKGNEWLFQKYPQVDLIWETQLEIPLPVGDKHAGGSEENSVNKGKTSSQGKNDGGARNEDDNDNVAAGDENDDETSQDLNENDDGADEDEYDDNAIQYDDEDHDDMTFEHGDDGMELGKSTFDTSESYDGSGDKTRLDVDGHSYSSGKSKIDNNGSNDEDEANNGDVETLFGDDNIEVKQNNRAWIVLAVILEVALLLYCMKR